MVFAFLGLTVATVLAVGALALRTKRVTVLPLALVLLGAGCVDVSEGDVSDPQGLKDDEARELPLDTGKSAEVIPTGLTPDEEAQLDRFHKDTVHWFVTQPGMGLSRIKRIPILPLSVKDYEKTDVAMSPWFKNEKKEPIPEHSQRQIMGFQIKGDGNPKDNKWLHVQLVSLLNHDEPRVYEQKILARMGKVSKATRPLNAFESEALKDLRAGHHLKANREAKIVRMMGAIRARKECLKCHDVHEGDLLGAFSYRLGHPKELHKSN